MVPVPSHPSQVDVQPEDDPDATAAMPDVRVLHDVQGDSWRLSPSDRDRITRFVDDSAALLRAVDAYTRRHGARLEQLAVLTAGVQQLAGEPAGGAQQVRDELAVMYAAAEKLRVAGTALPAVVRHGAQPPGGATHAAS